MDRNLLLGALGALLSCSASATAGDVGQTSLWDSQSPGAATPIATGFTLTEEPIAPVAYATPVASTGGLFDGATFFGGVETGKQPQTESRAGYYGARFEANLACALSEAHGIGWQLGSAIVAQDNTNDEPPSDYRFANYTTLGVFQRADCGINWGLVYDFLYQEITDSALVGQCRGQLSYYTSCTTEVGFRFALSGNSETITIYSHAAEIAPIDRCDLFLRKTYPAGVQLTTWLGIAEGHYDNQNTNNRYDESLYMGLSVVAPLSDSCALYASSNVVFPTDSGAVDGMFGLQWRPGGDARWAQRSKFDPMMPVASSINLIMDRIR